MDYETSTVKLMGWGVALAAMWFLFTWSTNTLPRIIELQQNHANLNLKRERQQAYAIGYKAGVKAGHAEDCATGASTGRSNAYELGYLDGLDDRATPPAPASQASHGAGPFVPIERVHEAMRRRGIAENAE